MNHNWHVFFLKMADLAATKSKDPSTKVGAVLVGEGNAVLGIGYNGFPRGVDDTDYERWVRPRKYFFAEHAERNIYFNAARHGICALGSTLYLGGAGGFPCADCARAIIQSGTTRVVMWADPPRPQGDWTASWDAAKTMLEEAGVEWVFVTKEHCGSEAGASAGPITRLAGSTPAPATKEAP